MFRHMQDIWMDVVNERVRQDDIHPDFPEHLRTAILGEEFGEVCKALYERGNLREELVHVAAVAVRWIQHLDREGGDSNDIPRSG